MKDKKNKLAPQIKNLRVLRQTFQGVEAEALERKAAFDEALTGVRDALGVERAEVSKLHMDIRNQESQYAQTNSTLATCDGLLARAQQESKRLTGGAGRHSKEYQSLTAQYTTEMNIMEKQSGDLRRQQKELKQHQEEWARQRTYFGTLDRLLKLKLRVSQQELLDMGQTQSQFRPEMGSSMAGVDRLIVGD